MTTAMTGTTDPSADTGASAASNPLKQKRARSQLSCIPCRTGKLKCNREKPACDQCIKRARDSSCVYVPPPVRHKPAQNVKGRIRQLENLVVDLMNQNRTTAQPHVSPPPPPAQATPPDASHGGNGAGPFSQPTPPSDNDPSPKHSERSEQSAKTAMTTALPSSPPPQDADVDTATTPFGQMKISKDEISYVGDTHWGAILNSISDLKRELGDDDSNDGDDGEHADAHDSAPQEVGWTSGQPPLTRQGAHLCGTEPQPTTGIGFMVGTHVPITKEQLIASVPEKRVADRLLSLWFNSPDPFKPVIHAPTFQDEYKRFWRSPQETPVMWLGLLFAIISLAASFGLRDNDPSSPHSQSIMREVDKYHQLSASAAVLADFTKPKEYTIECLILYAAGLRSDNAFVNVWLMIGLIVRLALRMGYHRDPKHYPNITVFQGEMRRRTWGIISMIDVLISFQLGLPSMVKTIQSDAEPPQNLLDRDFNPRTTVLPPSRSVSELTPSSYTRAKLRLTRIFADAAELSHATVPPERAVVIDLDRQLEEARAAIPPLLSMPDSELVTDPAEQLMCRFNLDLLYLKTKTVLHRRYMLTPMANLSAEEREMGIGTSRKICIDCALRVLEHHHTIYSASQPGGQLESVKWYMGSISTHDFLLAAMVICLELSQQINEGSFIAVAGGKLCPRQSAMMDALEKSQRIWAQASRRKRQTQFAGCDEVRKGEHMFDETEKAARAMAVMLEKVKAQRAGGGIPLPQKRDPETAHLWFDASRAPNGGPNAGATPFLGVMSMHHWTGDSPALPDGVGFGGTAFPDIGGASNHVSGNLPPSSEQTYNSIPGGTSEHTNSISPDQNMDGLSAQQDFSMIGDMLDVNTNLDWETWDNQITRSQQIQFPGLNTSMTPPDTDREFSDMRGGNTFNNGSDHANFSALGLTPGNATIPGGTGPLPPEMVNVMNNGFDANGFGNGSLELEMGGLDGPVPLQDVTFDLGPHDYNRNEM